MYVYMYDLDPNSALISGKPESVVAKPRYLTPPGDGGPPEAPHRRPAGGAF